jgi:hypothetical protein
MAEERFSRPHVHPTQAAPPPRAVGIPEQRSMSTPETATSPSVATRPIMDLARLTLAVIFAMLLLGVVMSFIMSRG